MVPFWFQTYPVAASLWRWEVREWDQRGRLLRCGCSMTSQVAACEAAEAWIKLKIKSGK